MRPGTIISTIPTPPASYNLIDLITLKILLGITATGSDPFLVLLIGQASAAAQAYANNPFVVEGRQDQIFPPRDGWPRQTDGAYSPLQLSRWPLTAVTSVVETISGVQTTLTSGTDFLIDAAEGQLVRLNTYNGVQPTPYPVDWRANPVTVQFSAGYATIPPDVVDAVQIMIKGKFFGQTRDPNIRQQTSPGIIEQSFFFATGPGGQGDLPVDAMAKLDRYRIPVFG